MKYTSLLLEALYPRNCLICGTSLIGMFGRKAPLCINCTNTLPNMKNPRCIKCSTSLLSEIDTCVRCRDSRYTFQSNYSLWIHHGIARNLIHQYKFNNIKPLSCFFGKMLLPYIQKKQLPIVPVPYRVQSKKKRGWDHIEEICKYLQNKHHIDIIACLKRKNQQAQKTLSFNERINNLQNSIVLSFNPNQSEVILLDDVFTTGATAEACTQVLMYYGVKRVYMLTLTIDE